jgi:NAD(P)-dependent dehydrogenase (short-subunit alcohol dehydrogenase family)
VPAELFAVEGRTVLVTGGARGIGRMIARGFIDAGAIVYVTARSDRAAEEAAGELSALAGGGACRPLVADLSTEDGCRRLARELRRHEPHLDVLVNNAGVMGPLARGELTDQVWHDVMAINVHAAFFLVRDLQDLLRAAAREDEPARVINIGSVAGSITSDLDAFPYSASKAALHHLTAHLARRLAPEITVNAVAPGLCDTDLSAELLRSHREAIIKGVPLKRLTADTDVVGATVFLASTAGAYLTGVVLPVDGGLSIP